MPQFTGDIGEGTGANHATDHLLRVVDRHLPMLNGQRNRRSGFDGLGLVRSRLGRTENGTAPMHREPASFW